MNINEAIDIAWAELDKFGLTQSGWSVIIDRARRRYGCCCHDNRAIALSQYQTELSSETEVLDTILHEIAHALVGTNHGHDEVWAAKAEEIGASPQAYYDRPRLTLC